MIPDLQASLLCDDVRQERNGKFILIGLFDVIGSQSFPLVFQRMCIVNRWCSGEGQFVEKTRIVNPEKGNVIAEGKEIPVRLPNGEATATNVEFFINVQFPAAGVYWIEILLDGDMRLRYPLRVNQINLAPSPSDQEKAPS
jgi:hypothetical protein